MAMVMVMAANLVWLGKVSVYRSCNLVTTWLQQLKPCFQVSAQMLNALLSLGLCG